MIEIRKFINKHIKDYKQLLDKNTFHMLFSNEPLSTEKVKLLSTNLNSRLNNIGYELFDRQDKIDARRLLFFGFFYHFTNEQQYIILKYSANYIYVIEPNNTINITNNLKLNFVQNERSSQCDVVILSDNNVVTNIGHVKDNCVIWNDKFVISNGIYIKYDIPSDDICRIILSKIILEKLV